MTRWRAGRSDAGAGMVELAVVMPVLLLLIVGIADVAIALNAYATITSSSRDGAHYAIAHPTASPQQITDRVLLRTSPLPTTTISVAVSYHDGTVFQPWPANGLTASSPPQKIPVRVEVTYSLVGGTIFLGSVMGFMGDLVMTSRSTMETAW